MVHFRDLFRRTKKRSLEQQGIQTSSIKPATEHFENGTSIATMPVAGMQRSNQGTFITSYTSVVLPQATSRISTSSTDSSTLSDSSKTAVDSTPFSCNEKSTWKGAPNGTVYDKREELTAEDEDMWANLAM